MSYLSIESFRFGLDLRRSEWTSQVGTLSVLTNAHINQGAEVEKRKAFVRAALPANTFGLETTSDGLVTFGSIVQPVEFPVTIGSTTVSYQRLQHPDGTTAMTGIVHSASFGGQAWVVARFSDGAVFAYYGGVIVFDFIAGLVLAYMNTNAEIATHLVDAVNRSAGYTAEIVAGVGNENKFDIEGVPAQDYSISIATDTTLGTYTITNQSATVAPVSAINAIGSFRIRAGSTARSIGTTTERSRGANTATLTTASPHLLSVGNTIVVASVGGSGYNGTVIVTSVGDATHFSYTSIGSDESTTADVNGTITATYNGISFVRVNDVAITSGLSAEAFVSTSAMALTVAEYINTNVSSPEYTASADGNKVIIYADSSVGDTPNGFVVRIRSIGNVMCGNCFLQFAVTNPNSFLISGIYANGANLLNKTFALSDYADLPTLLLAVEYNILASGLGGTYKAYADGVVLAISKLDTRSNDVDVDIAVTLTGGTVIQVGLDDDDETSGEEQETGGSVLPGIIAFADVQMISRGSYDRNYYKCVSEELTAIPPTAFLTPVAFYWETSGTASSERAVGEVGIWRPANTSPTANKTKYNANFMVYPNGFIPGRVRCRMVGAGFGQEAYTPIITILER